MKALVDQPAFNIAVFALLLSLPWELGQMRFYAGASEMSHLKGIQICMAATLGDALIMLVAFAIIAAFARSQEWVRAPKPSQTAGFVLIGLAVTIAIEIIATRADGMLSWRYAPAMPVTPPLGVGLAPLLMWLIVPLLVLWFVRRQIGPESKTLAKNRCRARNVKTDRLRRRTSTSARPFYHDIIGRCSYEDLRSGNGQRQRGSLIRMESGKSESSGDCEFVQLPSAAAGLRDALRAATADVHERLHCHNGLAAVQAGTIDREAYRQLLGRLYGFYRPFEDASQLPPERTRWLEFDLDALGVCATVRDTLPRCAAFPPRFSPDYVLGARYVVEGSALGGRGMARQLDPLLGPGVTAGRQFFSGHGAATGSVWRDYLALLSMEPRSEPECRAIIDGANGTFATFEQWLAGWNNNYE